MIAFKIAVFVISLNVTLLVLLSLNFQELEPYSNSYKNEIIRIGGFLDNEKDILNKVKKTYKNRYFTQQRNSL